MATRSKLAVSEAQAKEWQVPAGMVHARSRPATVISRFYKKLIGSKLQSMQQTISANNEQGIDGALQALISARRIHLAGVGASSLVARDFSYKLMKLGRNVMHNSDSHIQMANASTLQEGDVLFALSYSRTSIETLRIEIAVTGLSENPLSRIADIRLLQSPTKNACAHHQ